MFETVLVAVIPCLILLTLTIPWLRVLLAGLLATPVYAFLKMISFKFFLHTYRHVDTVRAEYGTYFDNVRYALSNGEMTGHCNPVWGDQVMAPGRSKGDG